MLLQVIHIKNYKNKKGSVNTWEVAPLEILSILNSLNKWHIF